MKKILLILLILGIGAFLRLYNLTAFPAGLNADEASLGYNAYSLIQTGRDEHGHVWPINFESFGDFKPALYGYILIPFIKVLGLTPLAVRLPSALAGILAIGVMFIIVRELFGEPVAYISAAYLAISPWHIHFSRGGWEVNFATTLILIGVWAFLKWHKNRQFFYLAICILGLVLSMYTYQSARLLAPVLGLGLLAIFLKDFISNLRQTLFVVLLTTLMLLPLAYSFVSSNAISRASGVSLFSDVGPINRVEQLRGQYKNPDSLMVKVLQNKVVSYAFAFVENYTDHFSGDFLFINGDVIERNKVPETGLLYWTDIIFLILGLVYIACNFDDKTKLIGFWLIIAPLAAAFTFQTPHALRAQIMIIPLTIIIALGLWKLLQKFNLKIILALVLAIYTWQLARYLHEYYVHYPQVYPSAWEYGFDQVVQYTESHKSDYNQILVTNKYDQPYILFLFYSKYPPEKFQFHHQLTVRDKFNFSTVNTYDKYTFMNTNWDKVHDLHHSLIIAAPEDIPDQGVNIVKTIYFPNGKPAFKIVAN